MWTIYCNYEHPDFWGNDPFFALKKVTGLNNCEKVVHLISEEDLIA